jgi:hypothetical protein
MDEIPESVARAVALWLATQALQGTAVCTSKNLVDTAEDFKKYILTGETE